MNTRTRNGEDPNNPIVLYSDGIFDLFHYGHARVFEQMKKRFKHVKVIAGVCGDKDTHARKGMTVNTEEERIENLKCCKFVDEVISPAPWIPSLAFLDEHDIDYICHDDIPYKTAECDDAYAEVKKAGRFLPTQRTDGISTSDLIERIVSQRDTFLLRNYRRGSKMAALNVTIVDLLAFAANRVLFKLTCGKMGRNH
jgi:choline-phosphate cytidylyltransferase